MEDEFLYFSPHFHYDWDRGWELYIPEIGPRPVEVTRTVPLKPMWSEEASKDLKAYHGIGI